MSYKQFEVNGVRYIGVEVHLLAKTFKILGQVVWETRGGNAAQPQATLPAGNYEIVGLVKDLRYRHPADAVGIESALIHFNLTDNTLILKIKENE